MELRVLRYFLMVAQKGNITSAARALHITQPTLSRQLRELEQQLDQQLFVRESHSVSLTREGQLLRRRAQEILELVQKTEHELSQTDKQIAGDIFIGAGETLGVHFLTKAAYRLQSEYPQVHFHISSGDGHDVCEKLDKGLIDFGLVLDHVDITKYHVLALPWQDTWGVLMQKSSPLAGRPVVRIEELRDQPLIVSRQMLQNGMLEEWFGEDAHLCIAGTYTLAFNGSLMVKDGMGNALCLNQIIHAEKKSNLCFRPIFPERKAKLYVIWKKNPAFSPAAEKYRQILEACTEEVLP